MPNALPSTFSTPLSRGKRHESNVNITTSIGTTAAIDMRGSAALAIHIPSGSSCTTLSFYGRVSGSADYVPIRDTTGTAVTQTVAADSVCVIKDEVYPFAYVKFVGNAAATACTVMFST